MGIKSNNADNVTRTFYTLGEIFAGRLFEIPDYQRGYAWEKKQCQDLLDDLSMMEEPSQQHFFGTLILHDVAAVDTLVDSNQQPCHLYHVIDGQQRLTTSIIYLDLLRRELRLLDLDAAQVVENNFIWIQDQTGFRKTRLTLNRDTHVFFQQAILERKAGIKRRIRSHERLAEVQQHFAEYLHRQRKVKQTEFRNWLQRQITKITKQLTLIVYTVGTEPEAAVIFTAMNDRGKTISGLEKIKSHLLQIAHKITVPTAYDLTEDVNHTWTHIFESLMRVDLGDRRQESRLLRAHWLMAYDATVKNWKGAETIQAFFDWRQRGDQQGKLLSDIRDYLDSLRQATAAFCDIYNPDSDGAFDMYREQGEYPDILRVSRQLIRVGSLATFLPLLMAVRLRYPEDGREYLETAELCERFAFRVYRWLGKRSNAGQSWLFTLGHKLYKDNEPIDVVQQEMRRAIHYYCPDEKFAAQFELLGNWYYWSGLRYFLYEYEHHLAQGQAVQMKWDYLIQHGNTIEHILPQTPDTDGYWTARFAPEDYARFKHDIGNLTLTYDNSKLKNRPFNDIPHRAGKRGMYKESVLFVERQLGGYEDWTPDAVEERRSTLKAWAIGRWQTPAPQFQDAEAEAPLRHATEADFEQVLTRLSVPSNQQLLYKALYDAGENGLVYGDLLQKLDRSTGELAGILGALGRRINNTPGYGKSAKPGTGMIMSWERLPNGEWGYKMRPEFRAVLIRLSPSWLGETEK